MTIFACKLTHSSTLKTYLRFCMNPSPLIVYLNLFATLTKRVASTVLFYTIKIYFSIITNVLEDTICA